jgi:hypothetical protein
MERSRSPWPASFPSPTEVAGDELAMAEAVRGWVGMVVMLAAVDGL